MMKHTAKLLSAYLVLGGVHEAAHWICALILGVLDTPSISITTTGMQNPGTVLFLFFQAILGRQASIQEFASCSIDQETAAVIRHSGWIVSSCLASILHFFAFSSSLDAHKLHKPSTWSQILVLAAYATALEALVTDLFQFSPTPASKGIFYCGNFGLILLNPMWFQTPDERGNCHSALKILQDMIRVTMMRGAQAGGVITFEPQKGGLMKGVRSRVVNRKRTDLSEGIIRLVRKDNQSNFKKCANTTTAPDALTFAGHTRFATSSIADFGGTHPHQWSPRSIRRVFDFKSAKPTLVGVENYIMHNGTSILVQFATG
jgi:hypothetical protein